MNDSIIITDLAAELDEEGEPVRGNLNRTRLLEPPSEATRKRQSIGIATERILAEIKENSGADVAKLDKNDSRGRNRFKDTLKLILCNLFSAWSTYDHGRRAMPATLRPYIAYSRSPSAYAAPKYKGLRLTYKNTIPIVNGLLALGYIENQNGFHDAATGKGRVSRMRATPRLILAMIGHGVEVHHVELDIELVRLRRKIDGDRKGEKRSIEIPLKKTSQVCSIAKRVAKVNDMLRSTSVELRITLQQLEDIVRKQNHFKDFEESGQLDSTLPRAYNTNNKLMYRVFNDKKSLKLGGRFYGHWVQGVPRKLRHNHLYINGVKAIEIDFDSIHPNLLYRLYAKVTPPKGDLYDLSQQGIDMNRTGTVDGERLKLRKIVKIALLTLINARTEKGAIQSLHQGRRVGRRFERGIAKRFGMTRPQVLALVEAIKVKHAPIAQWLCSEIGKELQYHDSRIAEQVMLGLWQKGIPCLCVHDSFLVQDVHQTKLEQAMKDTSTHISGSPIPYTFKTYPTFR
jgi:hypothetical protein